MNSRLNCTVRNATDDDLPSILEIENWAVRNLHAHFGEEDVTLEELARSFDRGYPWLVADVDGVVAGFARASAWKAREAYKKTTEIGVYVLPEYQGKGLARSLYEELLPMLRSLGFHTVLAGIALPNDPSVRLHEAFGMKHVGTLPEVGFKFGQWHSVAYWALVLDPPSDAG